MIAFLSGTILNKGNGYVILQVGGMGYKVFVNNGLYGDLVLDELCDIYIYQHVKEDALDLYGFRNLEELEFFELLISISGVGPKSGLGVLAIGAVVDLKNSIARGDSGMLVKVSGIGKKTAERVVLELQDKVGKMVDTSVDGVVDGVMANSDEIDALVALGYSIIEAREALKKVDSSVVDSGERIKLALRFF